MIAEKFAVEPELGGVTRLGLIEISGVEVRETPPELKAVIQELADSLSKKYSGRPPGEIEQVKAVRSIFHQTGIDPTRYRPSSESLLRRVVQGKGLYFINSAVDAANYCSLRTLLPMGLYDADNIKPPVSFRVGRDGETYAGIGRDTLHLAHFPVLADADGPFGSPISDSVRTRVTEGCVHLLWITFAPRHVGVDFDELAATMIRFNGGVIQARTEL